MPRMSSMVRRASKGSRTRLKFKKKWKTVVAFNRNTEVGAPTEPSGNPSIHHYALLVEKLPENCTNFHYYAQIYIIVCFGSNGSNCAQ
jgi:hypothetical protein